MTIFRSRFFWRLYAGYILVVAVAVAAIGVLVARELTHDALEEAEERLRVQAVLLEELAAPILTSAPDPAFQRRLRELGDIAGTRFTVIRADGSVLADSHEDPATMDDHASRPEVREAWEASSGRATRFSRTVAANLMYYAVRVGERSNPLGYVRVAVPLTQVEEHLAGLRRTVALGAILAATVALGLGLVVARRVTGPVASMTAAAKSIAGGDYAHRVASRSSDEIGAAAQAFNRMANELEARLDRTREDRAKLLTILGGMVEGVLAVDGDQRVVHINAAAGRILDVDPERAMERSIWEVTRVRRVSEVIEQVLRESREFTGEVRLQVDSQQRVVELHGAPLRSGQGTLVGAVLVLHDVTELQRLETVRRDFVANVSHELKTPITAIRGMIDTIVTDDAMPVETRDRFLTRIRRQSERLSLLVADLLTLARLESAEALLESQSLDLRETIRASGAAFQASAEERQVALTVTVPGEPVRVRGDAEALALLTNNLVDNALKYTPAGGDVQVLLRSGDGVALLEVRDTGIGIAREHRDRIFERFYRVDKARSRELGGTGLGLSIVKHVSRAHGGGVVVESAPGRGSTFRVTIPLASD